MEESELRKRLLYRDPIPQFQDKNMHTNWKHILANTYVQMSWINYLVKMYNSQAN